MQRPEGGAVLREALLRPAEAEGDISSHPEHSTHPFGGAVSVPTGGSAAGAQKIPQCQRYVWDPSPSLLMDVRNSSPVIVEKFIFVCFVQGFACPANQRLFMNKLTFS